MADLFAYLFVVFVVVFFKGTVNLLDEIDCIVLNTFLNVNFFLDLFSFSLFVPDPPFFFVQSLFFSTHPI